MLFVVNPDIIVKLNLFTPLQIQVEHDNLCNPLILIIDKETQAMQIQNL